MSAAGTGGIATQKGTYDPSSFASAPAGSYEASLYAALPSSGVPSTKAAGPAATAPVITSAGAQADLAQKQASFNAVQAANAQQAQKMAQQKLTAQQQAQVDAAYAQQQKNVDVQNSQKQQEIDAKNSALGISSPSQQKQAQNYGDPVLDESGSQVGTAMFDSKTGQPLPQSASQKTQSGLNSATSDYMSGQKQIQDQKDVLATQMTTQLDSLLAGTIPLTQPQQALISSIQAQLAQQKAEQEVANRSYTGSVAQAGFRAGGEYTPSQYAGEIANAVSYGVAKISALDNAAAKTIADLEQGFQKQNFEIINDKYDVLSKQLDDKSDSIKDMYDTVTNSLKDQRDQAQKQIDGVNKIAEAAAQNGADKATMDRIMSSRDEGEAVSNAGDYLQSATGQLGDYLQYKRATVLKGLTPMDYQSYKDREDAKAAKLEATKSYNNAYNSTAGRLAAEKKYSDADGSGGGKFAATVSQAADFEPAKTQASYQKNLQDLIGKGDYKSALLKIQNSVSKSLTGENKTNFDAKVAALPALDDLSAKLKAYADAGGDTGILKGTAEKIANKLGEVKDARFKSLATDLKLSLQKYRHDVSGANFSVQEGKDYADVNPSGNNKLDLNLSIIDGMKDNFQRQVDSAVESKVGEGARYIKEYANAKQSVNGYVASHPDKADMVSKLYEVPGTTDADVLEYITYLNNQ